MKKILCAATVIVSSLGWTIAQAATPDVNFGTVTFYGAVTEGSCTISVDGKDSDASVYLYPIARSDIKAADTLLKPKLFTIDVSSCQPVTLGKEAKILSVSWIGGNSLDNNNGYLANTNEAFGATNIQFALSTEDNLGSNQKIIPGDSNQPKAKESIITGNEGENISRFSYYVGYVTSEPDKVTSGDVSSYAIYQVAYE